MPVTSLTAEETISLILGLDDIVLAGGRAVAVHRPGDVKVNWESMRRSLVPPAVSDRLLQARAVICAGLSRDGNLHRAPQLVITDCGGYAIELHGGTLGVVQPAKSPGSPAVSRAGRGRA